MRCVLKLACHSVPVCVRVAALCVCHCMYHLTLCLLHHHGGQTADTVYTFNASRRVRDALFNTLVARQRQYDAIPARLGIKKGDVVFIGASFTTIAAMRKGGMPGSNAAKVLLSAPALSLCTALFVWLVQVGIGVACAITVCVCAWLLLSRTAPVATVLPCCRVLPCAPGALCQEAILAISRHARTVLVPEYYTSAKCPACRIDGNVFLKEDASTRSLHCVRCGTTWPRDVAAAVNLENVVRQWMVDGTRPAYLDSTTAWRFTHGTDPVAWSTLSQEELEKMKGFTTPQQFMEVFEAMLETEAVARTARYGAGGKRAARGKRATGTRARAGADGDDDDDDDDNNTDAAAPTGKPATLKRRARRRRRRERDKGVVDPAPATADTPPATPAAASAAAAAAITTAAAAAAAPSSTAASATVPTGFREAAGPSAPSSSSTTPSSASQTHLVASNNARDRRKPLEH